MDFRRTLYDRYVSTFKAHEESCSPDADKSYFAWSMRKYLPLVEDLATDAPVLDLGCGSGRFLAFLRAQGFTNLYGVDVSHEQVTLCRAKGFEVSHGDAFEYLRNSPLKFAAITLIDLVEHLTRAELLELFPLLKDALRDDGYLIIQTPNGQGLFAGQVIYGDLTHMTVFTPGSLTQLLQLHGLVDPTFVDTGPVAKNFSGAVRLLFWRAITGVANAIRRIESGKSQEIWTENLICRCRKSTATTQPLTPDAAVSATLESGAR